MGSPSDFLDHMFSIKDYGIRLCTHTHTMADSPLSGCLSLFAPKIVMSQHVSDSACIHSQLSCQPSKSPHSQRLAVSITGHHAIKLHLQHQIPIHLECRAAIESPKPSPREAQRIIPRRIPRKPGRGPGATRVARGIQKSGRVISSRSPTSALYDPEDLSSKVGACAHETEALDRVVEFVFVVGRGDVGGQADDGLDAVGIGGVGDRAGDVVGIVRRVAGVQETDEGVGGVGGGLARDDGILGERGSENKGGEEGCCSCEQQHLELWNDGGLTGLVWEKGICLILEM